MMRKNRHTLYCFSPPVMLATFAVEIGLILYAFLRYGRDKTTGFRLVVALLFFLAVFQLAEYFVCGGLSLDARGWSRLGYVAITTLPPLGLHLMHVLAGKPRRRLVVAAYASAIIFIGFFLFSQQVFLNYECGGNYIIFRLSETSTFFYQIYYYGWLLISILLGFYWLGQMRGSAAKQYAIHTISWLLAGYFLFLLPTAIVNSIKPETTAGIPSIMCGFAILLALILGFKILPIIDKLKPER